jgi:hypothetical protein
VSPSSKKFTSRCQISKRSRVSTEIEASNCVSNFLISVAFTV